MARRWWWMWLIVLVIVVAVIWRWRMPTPTQPQVTRLEIEIVGGFAYVPSATDQSLEIAYLNDSDMKISNVRPLLAGEQDAPVCQVDQIGTKLIVDSGTIVTPSPAPQKLDFDLNGAVVTLPALQSLPPAVTAVRGARPPTPGRPLNPAVATEWQDLKFVPSLKSEHSGTTINPNWRSMVNGRLVLRGGAITGMEPSVLKMRRAGFNFKASGQAKFEQAITDRTKYIVDVPASSVELLLQNAVSGLTRIVVAPTSPGQPVRLKLIGEHNMAASALQNDDELRDFCSFYQLLQPTPDPKDWLRPHFIEPPLGGNNNPQPQGMSPGFFCPGDWF